MLSVVRRKLSSIVDMQETVRQSSQMLESDAAIFLGSDSNLLIVFYVQIMPDDLVMQLHRF